MSALLSAIMFVMVMSQIRALEITEPIGNKLISLGDPLTIVCEHTGSETQAIGFKQNNNVIQNGVNGFRVSERLEGGKKIGTLNKTESELTDSGNYLCFLASHTSSVFMTVFKVDTVNGTEAVPTLQCMPQFDNDEDVKLEWLRDDKPIESDAAYLLSNKNQNLEFLNKEGIRQYMGVYVCKITKGGDVIYRGDVSLDAVPQVDSISGDAIKKEDQDLRLTCSVSGYPEPQIKWFKDGSAIIETDRVLFAGEKDEIILITEVKMSDSGDYSCRAMINGAEQAKMDIRVKIKDKLAALWPTIGILLEIIVLIIIIGVSEYRKRGKNKPTARYDDDDVDAMGSVGGSDAGDGEVRHRPTNPAHL